MEIWVDHDFYGNPVIYVGRRSFQITYRRECPYCMGGHLLDPYDPPCFACNDWETLNVVLFVWWALKMKITRLCDPVTYHYTTFVWRPTWDYIDQLSASYLEQWEE